MRSSLIVCLILSAILLPLVLVGQACTPGFKASPLGLSSLSSPGPSGSGPGPGPGSGGSTITPIDLETLQGKALYDAKCATCHGPMETSTKLGTSVASISRAIESEPTMASLKGKLSAEQVRSIALALNTELPLPVCDVAPDAGRVVIHRLNNTEYDNTLRDLLGTSYQPSKDLTFPVDEYAGNFNNNAKVLGLTPSHIAKYLAAAEKAVDAAFANTQTKARLVNCDLSQSSCVQQVLSSYLLRAFRRPPTPTELSQYTNIVGRAAAEGDPVETGVKAAMAGALVSPSFLFRAPQNPRPNDPTSVVDLSDFELASRLSYFIWSSMPDDTLLTAARMGQLKTQEQLISQAQRMLKDPKASALIDGFAAQWVHLHHIDYAQPDKALFPQYTAQLRDDFKQETKLLLKDIFSRDGSFFEILRADSTYLNQRLAELYGIPGVTGAEFRKVSLVGTERAGLMTHGSIMAINANPDRTSIVKRGKWVLENMLCTPPPPPPPEVVGSLPPSNGSNLTVRQRMELHRADPTCFSCHAQMDPIGFSLENFDPLGRYRTTEGSGPVDNRGEFPDGRRFTGAKELASTVAADRRFKVCVAEKLFAYSLGRGPEVHDRCTINKIGLAAIDPSKPVSAAIIEMVKSDPFRKQRGEGATR